MQDNPSYFDLEGAEVPRSETGSGGFRQWFRRPLLRSLSQEVAIKEVNTTGKKTMEEGVYYNVGLASKADEDTDGATTQLPVPPTPPPPSLDERYYNLQHGRRHSIGGTPARRVHHHHQGVLQPRGFLLKGSRLLDINANMKQDWRKKDSSWLQRRRATLGRRGVSGGEMADVVILYSKDCSTTELWVSYLDSSFQKMRAQNNQSPLRIHHQPIEDIHPNAAQNPYEVLNRAKLQVLIVSPAFLDYIYNYPDCGIGPWLHPNRVLAVLLGIGEDSVTEHHRAVMFSYQQWTRMQAVDQDIDFIGSVFCEASRILKKYDSMELNHNQKAKFTVFPKKVKTGYNKVLLQLASPLSPDDNIRATVDKAGHVLELEQVSRRNPYTLQATIPESCLSVSMLVTVSVEINGTSLGERKVKCESKMRELDFLLRSVNTPLEFLCQTLGFAPNALDQLDEFLAAEFQRNSPPQGFSFVTNAKNSDNKRGMDEYPTLLHFAARFGLHKLAWHLLEHAGGEEACLMTNSSDLTPAEMADSGGHQQLANALRGYLEMSELSHMYQYIKMVCEKPEDASVQQHQGETIVEEEDGAVYDRPRPMQDTYMVPPIARPVIQVPDNYDGMYLEMLPAMANYNSDKEPQGGTKETSLVESVQGELVDILNDYKNNRFTISEAERLFANWKSRIDVQKSDAEKQQQLDEMRSEYERIQRDMKDKMKKQTPFDRIARFFQRGKSKSAKGDKESTPGIGFGKERPASSLSTNSSISTSSSERMSIQSICSHGSLADSGNHSDSGEDRKTAPLQMKDFTFRPTPPTFQAYEVPPPPVPVTMRPPPLPSLRPPMLNGSPNLSRPPVPVPRPDSIDTYYIDLPCPHSIPEGSCESDELTGEKERTPSPEYLDCQDEGKRDCDDDEAPVPPPRPDNSMKPVASFAPPLPPKPGFPAYVNVESNGSIVGDVEVLPPVPPRLT